MSKANGGRLSDIYAMLGCSKQVFSKWENTPYSTHATARALKSAVIMAASELFDLTEQDRELLANSAGFSLGGSNTYLYQLLNDYNGKRCDLLCKASVSERMFQYYLHGKPPTKQALLAIAVSIGLSEKEIESLLLDYGYCLSYSIAYDAMIRWYLTSFSELSCSQRLVQINETLYAFGFPLIMTKLINR